MMIKVLSFNIHKGIGWHRLKSTVKEINLRIRELEPDLIFFQEILGIQAELMMMGMWPHYSYGKNVAYPTGHYGNAIFSKFPIIFSENFDLSMHRFERRGLLHSIVTLPDQSRLHLLCVHLGLLRQGRMKQLKKIAQYVESSIANQDAIILGGDFNDWGSHATAPLIQGLGLEEAFLTLHGAYAKTFPAWGPFLKLDRLYSRGLHVVEANRLVQRSWRFLSDHIGIEVNLEL